MSASRLDQLLQFHEEDPSDTFIRFALAAEYAKSGDFQKSRAHFEDLRSLDPDYVGLYYHLGKLLERMSLTGDALDTYRSGIIIASKISDFHARSELESALLELEMGEFE